MQSVRIGENFGDWMTLKMGRVAKTMQEVDDTNCVSHFSYIFAALMGRNSHV